MEWADDDARPEFPGGERGIPDEEDGADDFNLADDEGIGR
jgi:hypothetical protein